MDIEYHYFYLSPLTIRGLCPRDGGLDPALDLRHPGVHPWVIRVPTANAETGYTNNCVSAIKEDD